jgi:hypothetical protein
MAQNFYDLIDLYPTFFAVSLTFRSLFQKRDSSLQLSHCSEMTTQQSTSCSITWHHNVLITRNAHLILRNVNFTLSFEVIRVLVLNILNLDLNIFDQNFGCRT